MPVLPTDPFRKTFSGFTVQGRVSVQQVRVGAVGLLVHRVRRRELFCEKGPIALENNYT